MQIDPMVWSLSAAHPHMRPAWLRERMLPAVRLSKANSLVSLIRAIRQAEWESQLALRKTVARVAHAKPRGPTCREIAGEVISYYRVKENSFYSRRRDALAVHARQVAYYLCRELTQRSLPEIGRSLDGRDHTTILHGIRKIDAMRKTDPQVAADIEYMTRRLVQGIQFMEAAE